MQQWINDLWKKVLPRCPSPS